MLPTKVQIGQQICTVYPKPFLYASTALIDPQVAKERKVIFLGPGRVLQINAIGNHFKKTHKEPL